MVMKKHFPNSIEHGDIRTTDFSIYRGLIDFITGGDPCQPSSKAGKQKGFNDTRYLWPEKFRVIREVGPAYVVNENVRDTIDNGMLDKKISDLEGEGYACWPPLLMPIGAGEAISKRDRVYLVARRNEDAIMYNPGEVQSSSIKNERKAWQTNRERVRPVFEPVLNEHNWREVASSLCGNINGLSGRMDRIGAVGNSVDPRIIFEILKCIAIAE
jgi:DNA (cytosine-5)-methyltransferase 1